MQARREQLQNPCCPVWNTAAFPVEWLSLLFLAALLAVCSCICASIIFPLVSICACETSCFRFAHNGSSHVAPQACSASRAPGNSSPGGLLMIHSALSLFCLKNLKLRLDTRLKGVTDVMIDNKISRPPVQYQTFMF